MNTAELSAGGGACDLLLYHAWMSSASRRVRFCLEEKRLSYRNVALDLQKNEQHTVAYCAINPNGFVPALLHGERTIVECTVISEYLDEVFPQTPLRPEDPFGRARMRIWTKYVDESVIRDFQVASWNRIIRPVAARWSDAELEELLARIPTRQRREDWRRMARNPFRADEVAAALEGVREMIARMETALAASPWLAGDSFSLADIGVTPYVVRLDEFAPHGVSLRDAPAVADWWARVQARPGFVAARIGPIAQPGAPERAA